MTIACQLIAGGVAQHVRMDLERKVCLLRRSFHARNLSTASAKIVAACAYLRLRDAGRDISGGLSIQRFEFGNGISFRLALGMKSLGRSTDGNPPKA